MNITDIINEFNAIETGLDSLRGVLVKDDPGGEKTRRYGKLKEFRFRKERELIHENPPLDSEEEDMYDYVHDAILSDGEDMPEGYSATIVASYMDHVRCTLAAVTTPSGKMYIMRVRTSSHVAPGTTYPTTN